MKVVSFMSTRKQIVSNIAWAFSGKIVSLLSVLLVGILVARYLGPAQYGLLNYVISYVTIFTIISGFGLDDIEVREMSKTDAPVPVIIGTGLRLRIVFATVAYGLIVVTLIMHHPDKKTATFVLIYGLSVFPACANTIKNYFVSQLKNKHIVQSEIARTVVCSLFKLLLLHFKASLLWFIIASAFDVFVVSIGYYLSLRKHCREISIGSFDRKVCRMIIIESFPLMLSSSAIIIYQRIDQVMIGNMVDDMSVGYFATANRFSDLVVFVPIVICQTLTPLLVKAKDSKTASQYTGAAVSFIGIITWTSIILAVIVTLLSAPLISLTFGKEYLAAIPILQIMAWKAVGTALSSTSGQLIIIDGKQRYAALRNLLGCVTCILLNLLLIPRYGAIGSAVVTIFTVAGSGFIANLMIPSYREYFHMQCKALIHGPADIYQLIRTKTLGL